MLAELQYYLDGRVPIERTVTLCDCATYCHIIFGTAIQDQLTDLIQSLVDLPTDEAVDLLVDYVVETTISALAEFGITVNPDVAGSQQLSIYNEMLYTVLNVDQHEDPHRILALLEDVEDAEEGFATLVEELTGQSADDTLDVILTVDRDLLGRVQQLSAETVIALEAHTEPDDNRLRDRAIQRVKSSPCYDRQAAAEMLLAETGLFGVDVQTLLAATAEVIGELEGVLLTNACYQLACASDVDDISVCDCARSIADDIITDDQAVIKQQVARRLLSYPTPVYEG